MISIIFIVIAIAGAGWLAWNRWTYWRTPIGPEPSAERSPQTHAFEAFAHGNSCLVAGQCKHGQQILYLFGELSRLANGAPACLLPTVTRV
jgi:hypothetical protein